MEPLIYIVLKIRIFFLSLLIDTFGFGSQYEGDILFLEDDIELSKDAIKMIWYMLRIKNSHHKTIAVGLGGWSGENLINPHPDTVVIRYVILHNIGHISKMQH